MTRRRPDHEWERRKDKARKPKTDPLKAKKGSAIDLAMRLKKALKRNDSDEIRRLRSLLLNVSPSFRGSQLDRSCERAILASRSN